MNGSQVEPSGKSTPSSQSRAFPAASNLAVNSSGEDGIVDEVRVARDQAARLISDGLVMAHHLRNALHMRWRLIREIRVMSNGMRDLATHAPGPNPADPPKADGQPSVDA